MNSIKPNDQLTGSLSALGCEILFGLSYIFTKQATTCASEFALLGWRFLVAVLAMSLCIKSGLIKVHWKGKSLKPVLMVALCSPCIYFIAETIGISSTTASESGVFLACIPVVSLVASTVILKKKPSGIQILGIFIARHTKNAPVTRFLVTLAGVMLTVFAVGMSSRLSVYGYGFLTIAVLSYSLYSVFVDRASDFTGAEITYVMLVAGAFLFILLAIAEAVIHENVGELVRLPFQEWSFTAAVLYQGIGCSVVAFFLSNIAISKIGVNRTSSFIGVATVVSIVAGAFLLKEAFTGWQIAGAVVIVLGVYVANSNRKQ